MTSRFQSSTLKGETSSSSSSVKENKDINFEHEASTSKTNHITLGDTASATTSKEHQKQEEQNDNSTFECNICLDVAKDAVISLCGHLFCWPCLHRWLETRPQRSVCPVCKAGISKDNVIPIYGKDNPNKKDPREKLPPRPQAQRPEPETNYNPFNNGMFGGLGQSFGMPGANNNGGLHFSFGIGAFPFTFLTWTFGNGNNQQGHQDTQQEREEQFLSRAFLWLAVFFIIWLMYA